MRTPWAWCWFPSEDVITIDPDVTDRREPRPISTLRVNWARVLHAVRTAVDRASTSAGTDFQSDVVLVDVPIPLTDLEFKIVRSWVCDSPVTYWYEEPQIEDGRHRLWLTRRYTDAVAVPMLSSNLYHLNDAFTSASMRETAVEVLDTACAWWSGPESDGARWDNRAHRRSITLAYLWLCQVVLAPP